VKITVKRVFLRSFKEKDRRRGNLEDVSKIIGQSERYR
jgi:hypothetical protein